MLKILENDLLYIICYELGFETVLNVSACSKEIRSLFTDDFYKGYAFHIYGKTFWEIASKRSSDVSRPLSTYFEELQRLEKFQLETVKATGMRFSVQEFFRYWICIEPSLKLHVI